MRGTAFGRSIAFLGTTLNSYLFAGEQRDQGLGLDYLRARYLNTATGTFVSRDTFRASLNDPRSLHRYAYATSNPANHVDPSGLQATIGEAFAAIAISTSLTFSFGQAYVGKVGRIRYGGEDIHWSVSAFLPRVVGGGLVGQEIRASSDPKRPDPATWSWLLLGFDLSTSDQASATLSLPDFGRTDVGLWSPAFLGTEPKVFTGAFVIYNFSLDPPRDGQPKIGYSVSFGLLGFGYGNLSGFYSTLGSIGSAPINASIDVSTGVSIWLGPS